MNYTIELYEMKSFFILDMKEKVIITIMIILTILTGIFIQKQIYKFLKRRKDRLINKMIITHGIGGHP